MSHALTKSSTHSFNYVSSHALEANVGGGTAFIDWSIDVTNRKIITRNAGGVDIYDADGGGFIGAVSNPCTGVNACGTYNGFSLSDPSDLTIKSYNYSGTKTGELTQISQRGGQIEGISNTTPWYAQRERYALTPHNKAPGLGVYDSPISKIQQDTTLSPILLGAEYGIATTVAQIGSSSISGSLSNSVTAASGTYTWTISNNQIVPGTFSISSTKSGINDIGAQIIVSNGEYQTGRYPNLQNKYSLGVQIQGSGQLENFTATPVIHDYLGNILITGTSTTMGMSVSHYLSYLASETNGKGGKVYGGRYMIYASGSMVDLKNNTESTLYDGSEYSVYFQSMPQDSYWNHIMLKKDDKLHVGTFNTDTRSISIKQIWSQLPIPRNVILNLFTEENYVYFDHLESGSHKISRINIGTGIKEDIVVV